MRDEAFILDEMRRAVDGEKVAGEPTGWAGDTHADQMSCVAPFLALETEAATAQLVFRMRRLRPDRDCSATLVVTHQGRDFRAWRMDWRPNTSHLNRVGPADLRGADVETGVHGFADNAVYGLARMQADNLPVCRPVDEPHDFSAFVRAVCAMLRVTLTEPIPEPPWSPRLF